MANKQKLEITWIGKNVLRKPEPRILPEDYEEALSCSQRVPDRKQPTDF